MPGIIGSVITAKEDEIEVNLSSYFVRTKYLVLAEKYYDMTALHSTTHFLSCRILIFQCASVAIVCVQKLQELAT